MVPTPAPAQKSPAGAKDEYTNVAPPASGYGQEQAGPRTVVPELPNSRYRMMERGSLKTALLKSEQNTPEMEQEVDRLIASHPVTETHKQVASVYEHGQWWAVCGSCGAIWSVVDAEGGMSAGGLDLEDIKHGDDSCFEGNEGGDDGGESFFSDKDRFFDSVRNKHKV
jgi:hypothetical protein